MCFNLRVIYLAIIPSGKGGLSQWIFGFLKSEKKKLVTETHQIPTKFSLRF